MAIVTQMTPSFPTLKRPNLTLSPENSFYGALPLVTAWQDYILLALLKPSKRHWRALTWLLDMEEIPTQKPRYFRLVKINSGKPH